MTTLVLLVLAIVWGALLVSWLRSRTQGGLTDSVGTFNRHLKVLGRTTPATVAPANRLRSGPVAGIAPPPYRGPAARRPVAPRMRSSRTATEVALRRRAAQRRRRDVLLVLIGAVIVSLGVAAATGSGAVWALQVVCDLALAGYVVLLVRLRNLAAERELKLTFMPQQARSGRPRPSYELSSGYGDLDLRRAN